MTTMYVKIAVDDLNDEIWSKALNTNPVLLKKTNDGKYVILEFDVTNVPYSILSTDYTAFDSNSIKAELAKAEWDGTTETSLKMHSGKISKNVQKVAQYEPEGDFLSRVTHDFSDKTTWWNGSVLVEDEVLTLDTGTTYASNNTHWIDLNHGKVTGEDTFSSEYIPVIKDDGVTLTEGTDYTIDHDVGSVTLSSAPNGPVTASYNYANTSEYILSPSQGRVLTLKHAELQFSTDIQIEPITFEIWAYNPYDLPNKFPAEVIHYKNARDIMNIANLGYTVPKFSGMQNDMIVLPFNYSRAINLYSSMGLEIRVKIKDDKEMAGEFATVTFYTVEDDE